MAVPLPWFDTQKGLVALKDIPQGFIRFVSGRSHPGKVRNNIRLHVFASSSGRGNQYPQAAEEHQTQEMSHGVGIS